jgi:O-antigen/teichoic acid export membrane protein
MINAVQRIIQRLQSGSAGWALIDQGFASGVTFLTGILVARLLGPEQFGVFGLLFMVILFFNSAQYSLIASPMMSIAPQLEGEEQTEFLSAQGSAAFVLIGLSVMLTLLAGEALSAFKPEWSFKAYTWPLVAAVASIQTQEFYRRLFFTAGQPKRAGISAAWRYGLQLSGLIVLYQMQIAELDVILWLMAGSAMSSGVIAHLQQPTLGYNTKSLKRFARRSWTSGRWIFGSTLLQWMTGNYFAVVAGALVGPIAVGALRATQQLLAPVQVVTLAATNVIPIAAAKRLSQGGTKAMNLFLWKVGVAGGIATALIGVILTFGGDFWLVLVFGPKFAGFGYLIPWLSGAMLIFYWEIPLQAGLRALEDTRALFWGYLVAAVLSLGIAHALVQAKGTEGAAIGIMFSHVIFAATQLLGLYLACRNRNATP